MEKIKNNDYIGVISSSGLLKEKNKEEIEKSIELVNQIGLKVKLGKYVYESNVNNLIENKICDFNDMVTDKIIKMIIFSFGGNNVIDIIDNLDYESIKNNPKIRAKYINIFSTFFIFSICIFNSVRILLYIKQSRLKFF